MKIVFFGTPDIAAQVLDELVAQKHYICCVVTAEDKPRGRHAEITPSEVKTYAVSRGINVETPHRLKNNTDIIDKLKQYDADVFVVIAYGKIIPKEMLCLPRKGCINIHASLLPEYRGAAPIQWAIIDGRKLTGITTMLMDEGLDTGDILKKYPVPISNDDTGESLFNKMTAEARAAITDTLNSLDTIQPVKQGETTTEYAAILKKEDGLIDWSKPADRIRNLIRGLNPWPTAYTTLNGKMLKIWDAEISEMCGIPGRILNADKSGILVACGQGSLLLKELQLEGKKRMKAVDLLNGIKLNDEAILGK